MKKSLFALAILSIASSNAFSFELIKGKLLEQKELTTKNVKTFVKDIAIDKNKLAQLLKNSKDGTDSYIKANATIRPMAFESIQVSKIATIHGENFVVIVNNSAQEKVYSVTQEICTTITPEEDTPAPGPVIGQLCTMNMIKFSLLPSGYVATGQTPSMNFTYYKEGTYRVSIASTIVQITNMGVNSEVFRTEDSENIFVSEEKKKWMQPKDRTL